MPFQSEAQRRYMWMQHPEIARRWAHEFPKQKKLPYHKKHVAKGDFAVGYKIGAQTRKLKRARAKILRTGKGDLAGINFKIKGAPAAMDAWGTRPMRVGSHLGEQRNKYLAGAGTVGAAGGDVALQHRVKKAVNLRKPITLIRSRPKFKQLEPVNLRATAYRPHNKHQRQPLTTNPHLANRIDFYGYERAQRLRNAGIGKVYVPHIGGVGGQYKSLQELTGAERIRYKHSKPGRAQARAKEDVESKNKEVRDLRQHYFGVGLHHSPLARAAEGRPYSYAALNRFNPPGGFRLSGITTESAPGKPQVHMNLDPTANIVGGQQTGTSTRAFRHGILTHEMQHARDIEANPRLTARKHYAMIHNEPRAMAMHAAMEGRAVGHAQRVAPQAGGNQAYEEMFGAHEASRVRNAYNKGKAHPYSVAGPNAPKQPFVPIERRRSTHIAAAGTAIPVAAVGGGVAVHERRKRVGKADSTFWGQRLVDHHQGRMDYHKAQLDRLHSFRAAPKKKARVSKMYEDAFGVERPDLAVGKRGAMCGNKGCTKPKGHSGACMMSKADKKTGDHALSGARAKRQRRVAGGLAAIPAVGGYTGLYSGAHYAPKGHRLGGAGRAFGRGLGEGILGSAGGGVTAAALSRGKATRAGTMLGGMAGEAHGTSSSVRTTQRRYGVKQVD